VSDQEQLLADPAMLVLARDSRGWTQSELAEQMSHVEGSRISQGYVSRAEAGRIPVRAERVLLFAAALRLTPEMLCQAADTAGAGIGLIHHRKRASLGAPALRRIHATLALTRLQVEAVTRAAALRHSHRFRHIEVNDFDTPADAAETLREEWNVPIGPIDDLVALLEHAGALVVVRDLGTTELDAVSQWPHDRAPLVLLNSTAPGDRSRFSLAHELGHLIMHREPGEGRTQETQADRFAAEFLMPHEVILGELKPGIDVARLMDLKARWGVSMAALIRRAVDLGVISEWQYRTLMVELSALGYRTSEPIVIRRETPRHIAQAVTRLEGKHHLSATETAHLAGLGREEFHEIYLCASSPSGHKDVPDPSAR
jgi:Zn-dependent peptidase ImmA (M78 family)